MCTTDVQVKFYNLGIRGFDDIQMPPKMQKKEDQKELDLLL